MAVSLDIIKELRAITHAPLGDCKKVLEETDGNIEQAKELLKERGLAKASKKTDRETNNGVVRFAFVHGSVVGVTVLCETDFVAKNDTFLSLVDAVLQKIIAYSGDVSPSSMPESLLASCQTYLDEHVATVGEKLVVSLLYKKAGQAYVYNHMGNTLSSVVYYSGGNEEFAKGVALQVAAMNPQYCRMSDIPESVIAAEREKFVAEVASQGKPADIVAKIVEGKVTKAFQDDVLLEQLYIKDQTKIVSQAIGDMEVISFERFSVL